MFIILRLYLLVHPPARRLFLDDSGGVTALGGEARLFQAACDSYQAHFMWLVAKLVGCCRY